MRDLHNNIRVEQTVNPATANSTVTGATVDRQGYDSIEHVVLFGASGDTLSTTLKWEATLYAGDQPDMSDEAVVTSADDVLPSTALTSGIFATVDAAAKDDAQYRIGYRGPKRYTRVKIAATGTHTVGTPIGAAALKGTPEDAPASDS